jgi:hypothetical protein
MGIVPKLVAHSTESPDEELALEGPIIFLAPSPAVEACPSRACIPGRAKCAVTERREGRAHPARLGFVFRAASPHDVTLALLFRQRTLNAAHSSLYRI